MPWTCLKLAAADVSDDVDSRFLGVFTAWHVRAGSPSDVAIFREENGVDGTVLYFSPASIHIVASVMAHMGIRGGPVACDRPPRKVPLYFGTPDAAQRLLGP